MDLNCDKIRDLRLRLGWSQAEFARQLGTTLERVQEIEKGCNLSPSELSNCLKWLTDIEPICDQIRKQPIAEKIMNDQGLSQVEDILV